jgi:hypothetical protein
VHFFVDLLGLGEKRVAPVGAVLAMRHGLLDPPTASSHRLLLFVLDLIFHEVPPVAASDSRLGLGDLGDMGEGWGVGPR